MNIRDNVIGVVPKMGGIGHVTQVDEKQEPEKGEHVAPDGDEKQATPTPEPER